MEESDIMTVVRFLAFFLNNAEECTAWIADLLKGSARLLDDRGNDVFAGRFIPLMQRDAEAIYADILRRLFNAEARQRLKLVNLKGSKGELALRVGNAPHFGVINIGDDAGFFKNAEDVEAFDTETDDFGSGLFGTINQQGSKLNVLIGSRKFTEGWSSWRVSTMGLLNMGQGEGSQIIQLFGRGVRLKGKGMSLKRSLPHERPKGVHLERLETLNIFGVRANYMAAFKDYLKEEGIMVAISFARHLYYPMMAPDITGNLPLKMRPLAFDVPSEVQFVRDLAEFYSSPAAKELLAGRSLYLLRNADTQAKGLGFARAGNFYPDFLLWLVDDTTGQQWLSFVDPKGIRNLDLNDPKLGLYAEIKEREHELGDAHLTLNAFILSYTRYDDLLNVGSSGSKAELEDRHVLFMDDGRDTYLKKLFERIAA